MWYRLLANFQPPSAHEDAQARTLKLAETCHTLYVCHINTTEQVASITATPSTTTRTMTSSMLAVASRALPPTITCTTTTAQACRLRGLSRPPVLSVHGPTLWPAAQPPLCQLCQLCLVSEQQQRFSWSCDVSRTCVCRKHCKSTTAHAVARCLFPVMCAVVHCVQSPQSLPPS